MSEKIVVVPEFPGKNFYPIRPEDIDIELSSTFGKAEVEKAARYIVLLCKQRGGWYPFSIEELRRFYIEKAEDPNMMFFGIMGIWDDDAMGGGLCQAHPNLVVFGDGMYCVTEHFIKRCAKKL